VSGSCHVRRRAGSGAASAASVGVAADGGRDEGICHAQGSGPTSALKLTVLAEAERALGVPSPEVARYGHGPPGAAGFA
jgi:hypothetical protein